MDIHDLVRIFAGFDYAQVGRGSTHPEHPNLCLANDIDNFFTQYPMLQKDQDYVTFMRTYAGAEIAYPDMELMVQIYGLWSDYVVNVLYPDEPLVEHERYFRFADIGIQPPEDRKGSVGVSFAFDIIGHNTPRVHYKVVPFGRDYWETPYKFFCDTFLEWMGKLVATGGRLIPYDKTS